MRQVPYFGLRNDTMANRASVALLLIVLSSLAASQSSKTVPLVVETQSLPKAFSRQPYEARLQASGGFPPLKWEVTEGNLPGSMVLQTDGDLKGTPAQTGEFRFTATVTDSSRPANQLVRQFVLLVVSPLMAQWGRYPKVNGQRLEGSILISNETDRDFDLTVIVLAVNEIGRATAIGYQHFTLKKNSDDIEIPFGDNLASGSYQLNADAVAEVAATNSIFRTRLVPKEAFQIQQNP
jgi:Putative Ig domain